MQASLEDDAGSPLPTAPPPPAPKPAAARAPVAASGYGAPAAAPALSHSRKVKLVAMCEAYDANSDDRLPLQRLCDVELSGISAQAELAAEALTKRWRARLDGGETVIGEAAVMADWLALPPVSDDEFEAIVICCWWRRGATPRRGDDDGRATTAMRRATTRKRCVAA